MKIGLIEKKIILYLHNRREKNLKQIIIHAEGNQKYKRTKYESYRRAINTLQKKNMVIMSKKEAKTKYYSLTNSCENYSEEITRQTLKKYDEIISLMKIILRNKPKIIGLLEDRQEPEIKMTKEEFGYNYQILGINRNASESEIKRAYKQLAKKYHPDLNKSLNAKERFMEIEEAYNEALNPKVEDKFDIFGSSHIFGGEVNWVYLVRSEDFNVKGFLIDSEEYKKYRWTQNKLKLLMGLYEKIAWLRTGIRQELNKPKIISHLQKVLNNEVDIKERIPKPFDSTSYRDKLEYNVMNQFHPKFINKFPMRIQIFLRNKIRDMIIKIEDSSQN